MVEELFPERNPTNVKNRWVLRSINGSFRYNKFGLSYAAVKNLRQRGKISAAATPASPDVAEVVDATTFLSTKEANNGSQGSNSSNSKASTADLDSPMNFENAVYSAGPLDDDFG